MKKSKQYVFENPASRTQFVRMMLAITALLGIAAVVSGILEYRFLAELRDGGEFDAAAAESNDLRQGTIGLVRAISMLVTVIAFGRWTYRIVANAHAVSSRPLRNSPGWAVGSYFIPILNLWRPFLALREAYLVFCAGNREDDRRGVFALWWSSWIVSTLVSNGVSRLDPDGKAIERLIDYSVLTTVSDGLDALAAFAALQLVRVVGSACRQDATVAEVFA